MFKSYWTIAWRTLVRHRVYTFVNVLGLTLGICACLVIWVIVHYELSFDRGHPGADRIYRIISYEQYLKNEPELIVPAVLAALPPAVEKEVPGIETVAVYHVWDGVKARVPGFPGGRFSREQHGRRSGGFGFRGDAGRYGTGLF